MYEGDSIPNLAPIRLTPPSKVEDCEAIDAKQGQNKDESGGDDAVAVGHETSDESKMPEKGRAFEFEMRPNGCDIVPPTPEPQRLSGSEVRPYVPLTANKESLADVDDEWTSSVRISAPGRFLPFIGSILCIVVLMWLFVVSSPLLASSLTLHGWRFWATLVLALLPTVLVLGLVAYCWIKMRRLPRVEQFCEKDYSNKAQLQRNLVSRYLESFPDIEAYAVANGFADEAHGRQKTLLANSLSRLKGGSGRCYSDSRGWLAEFMDFQSIMDARAEEVISRTWKFVAVKTAASPWKIVDMIAVVYNSTVMLTRIAGIYNRRVSSSEAFRLVCRWFVNIYIAGEMGDMTQGAVEWASASNLISATYKPLAGVVGKVAEGGANAFLVYRLGRRAMEYFRPLVEVKVE